jgi:hypothetical protein
LSDNRQPRVILVDIETAPSTGHFFELYKEGNIVHTTQSWYMLSFAYKVHGEKRIHFHCLADYPNYDRDKTSDKALVTDLHRLVFSNADCLVGHNIDKFDNRKSKARFLAHGLPPPPPVKTIDTLKLVRRVCKMDSNRLGDVGAYLGLGGKVEHEGFGLWLKCMAGDRAAWKRMREYNVRDVDLLEQVYDRLVPWHPNHPILRAGQDCPQCGSEHAQRRGWNLAKQSRTPRLQCQRCGHWYSGQRERIAA